MIVLYKLAPAILFAKAFRIPTRQHLTLVTFLVMNAKDWTLVKPITKK
jgi:hypothetical protein